MFSLKFKGLPVLLLLLALLWVAPSAYSNTNCPESTSSLGSIMVTGTCTISVATTWENGTMTITGDIIVNEPLTLRNVFIIFNPSFEGEWEVHIFDAFDMDGGGISSATAFHWRVEVFGGPANSLWIRNANFNRGTWNFRGQVGGLVENNVFANVDARHALDGQHMWVGRDFIVRNNLLDDISLGGGASIVMYNNAGPTKVWGNELHLRCFGLNCMGIEVYGAHENIVAPMPLAPFPSHEIAWNNVTWLEIVGGTNSASFDNEYSMRLYIHNNTQTNLGANRVTSPLEMGGVIDSVLENNTISRGIWGVYQYIYENAGSVIQYNTFDDMTYAGIIQSGNNTYRHNTYTNLINAGQWVCPDSPCAGSGANPVDNVFYNNSYSFTTPTPTWGIALTNPVTRLGNTFLVHGDVGYWSDPFTTYSGDWVFWAPQTIDQLKFENIGSFRRLSMNTGGQTFWDDLPGASTAGTLTVGGAIDQDGSTDPGATFLSQMTLDSTTLTVNAVGSVTFDVSGYFANTVYDIIFDGVSDGTFTTDAAGAGSFTRTFNSQHTVTITGAGTPPPPPPPAPVGGIDDLTILELGPTFVLFGWSAPGNATLYDFRFSPSLIDVGNFQDATRHAIALPPFDRLNVTGLRPGVTYWFALRFWDGSVWNPISNVVSVTLP